MKTTKLIITIIAGMVAGQIFAEEGDRPFKVTNTIRVGYDDNVWRTSDAEASAYFRDMLDLSFNAALSDRTEMVFKSRFEVRTDKENDVYPNLYTILRHTASPRLMFTLSDKFKRGNKTSSISDGRRNYWRNRLDLVTTYVLDEKNRLEFSVDNEVRRHDTVIEMQDLTSFSAGVAWSRDIRPQRTSATLSLRQQAVDYDERDSSYDSTVLMVGVNHTISENWQGTLYGGMTRAETDFGSAVGSSSSTSPIRDAGLIYSPSPRTRLSGNFTHRYEESESSAYGAQTSSELRFSAQHDVTARILAKAMARIQDIEYDQGDEETGARTSSDQQRVDLELKLSYKLNRLNFLEFNLKHSEKEYKDGFGDWEQNMVDVGWRVEL